MLVSCLQSACATHCVSFAMYMLAAIFIIEQTCDIIDAFLKSSITTQSFSALVFAHNAFYPMYRPYLYKTVRQNVCCPTCHGLLVLPLR